jgi:hypothetical protein
MISAMDAYDLTVALDNQPGSFAGAAEALAQAGVNVEGIAGWGEETKGQVHFLVLDQASAADALTTAGYTVERTREVIFRRVTNEPGVLDRYAGKLADAGVNIEAVYLAAGTRLVVVTDDFAKAQVVWDELAAQAD